MEPVNYSLAAAVDYQNYCLLKKSSCYEEDVTHDLHKMAKKIAVQMKDSIFS